MSGIEAVKRFSIRMFTIHTIGFGLSLCSVAGCERAKPGQLPVYRVRGEVTFNGEPLPEANVTLIPMNTFESDQPEKYPYACGGLTDDDGRFVLTTYRPNDGAPEGEYAVSISCENRDRRIGRGEYAELLPAVYQSPTESKLTATISKGVNELPVFELVGNVRQKSK